MTGKWDGHWLSAAQVGFACLLAVAMAVPAGAETETVLHNFAAPPTGADPLSGLVRDAAGNFYGTAAGGGLVNAGVVFKVDAAGHETVLYNFKGGADGRNPQAVVIGDAAGNLYGTTYLGGAANAGVVYKLDAAGNETVLYTFTGGADGGNPHAGVIRDSHGNLYGTTNNGGSANAGVVYKVDTAGHETVLYGFTGGADGKYPYAGVIGDSAGNLYGTTSGGGSGNAGVVFKLDGTGHETVLYSFTGGSDGGSPYGGVVRDKAGNLYGTTKNAVQRTPGLCSSWMGPAMRPCCIASRAGRMGVRLKQAWSATPPETSTGRHTSVV